MWQPVEARSIFALLNTALQIFYTLPNVQVFFNEGSGRLECEDGGDPGTTTKYVLITFSSACSRQVTQVLDKQTSC